MNLLKQCQTLTFFDHKLKEHKLELGKKFLENGFSDDGQDFVELAYVVKGELRQRIQEKDIQKSWTKILQHKKIIAFLQPALMEQKQLQQYVHFHPTEDVREEIEHYFSLLINELYEDQVGSLLIVNGLLFRIFIC